MNYEDQVLALFGEANPVSDLDTLEDLMSPRLEVVEQRTGDMTDAKVGEIDLNRPIFKKDRRFGLVYGLAAALVVLMIGSVVWAVFLNDSEPDVAGGLAAGTARITIGDTTWEAVADIQCLDFGTALGFRGSTHAARSPGPPMIWSLRPAGVGSESVFVECRHAQPGRSWHEPWSYRSHCHWGPAGGA